MDGFKSPEAQTEHGDLAARTDFHETNSISFDLFCIIYNRFITGCFTEAETRSLDPQVSTQAGKKHSFLTERNVEHDQAHREEPSC